MARRRLPIEMWLRGILMEVVDVNVDMDEDVDVDDWQAILGDVSWRCVWAGLVMEGVRQCTWKV